MKMEKVGAGARLNASTPGLLLGSSEPLIAQNGPKSHIKAGLNATAPSGVHLFKADFARFVDGAPSVAMEWRGGAIHVGLTVIPWGWQDRARAREFFDEHAAYIHAARLLREIARAGQAERDRRERKRIARLRERESAR